MASVDDAPAVRPEARAPHAPDFLSPENPLEGEQPSSERELRRAEWRAIHQRRFRIRFPDQTLPAELAPAAVSLTPALGPIALAGAKVRFLIERLRETRGNTAEDTTGDFRKSPVTGFHVPAPAGPDFTLPPENLAGLALSGGGIRSATFCLGVLQGLRERNLLGVFDYLSTVSGGGFVGGWWSAWLSRRPMPNPPRASELFPRLEQLEPDRYPPRLLDADTTDGSETTDATLSASVGDAIHHLRLYANYLTPRKGALSADLWRAITTISRNIVLTWLVFGLVLFAAMLLASAYYVRSDPLASRYVCSAPELIAGRVPVTLADSVCAGVNHTYADFSHRRVLVERLANAFGPAVLGVALMILLTGGWLVYGAISPIPTLYGLIAFGLFILKVFVDYPSQWFFAVAGVMAAALLLLGLPEVARDPSILWGPAGLTARGVIRTRLVHFHSLVLRGTVVVTVIVLFVGFAHELIWWLFYVPSGPVQGIVKKAGGIGALLLAVVSTIYAGFTAAPSPRGNDEARATNSTHWLVLLAPPLALFSIAVLIAWGTHSVLRVTGAAVGATLIRGGNAPTFAAGVAWALIAGAYLQCAFAAIEYWTERVPADRLWRSVAPLGAAAVATITFQVLTPVRVQSLLTRRGVAVDIVRADMIGQAMAGLTFILILFVCVLCFAKRANDRTRMLLILASFAFATVIAFSVNDPTLADRSTRLLFIALATAQTALAAAIGLGWMTDPNLVALHSFYKSRLVRGYLGASNTARHGHQEITDTVAGDDLLVSTLRNTEQGAPYHLINTTLNFVVGRYLAT